MAKTLRKFKKTQLDEYQSIYDIAQHNSQFSVNQLRWIVANKERYGLAGAIKRIGRKLYFHVPSLVAWVEQQEA